MNVPYKKQFNEAGDLLNPIESIYLNEFPNRKQRRLKTPRFVGNGKQYHLSVTPIEKYYRRVQIIAANSKKDQPKKIIYHYDLV